MTSARVLVIDAQSARTAAFADALGASGLTVVGIISDSDDIHTAVRSMNPDMILIGADSPSRDTLEGLAAIGRQFPRPILMLSESNDSELVREASRLGISAYAIDGISPLLLRSIMEVTTSHFNDRKKLSAEVEDMQRAMMDRKAIDRAKYQLVQQCGLSEDAAYHRLRKTAMERGMKLGDLAREMLGDES